MEGSEERTEVRLRGMHQTLSQSAIVESPSAIYGPSEMNSDWVRRRWFDLRNGHSLYLVFVLQFIQFVLVLYIKFPDINIYGFAIALLLVYSALGTAIGYYYHRKRQLRTDQDSVFEQSRLAASVSEVMLKAVIGKASNDEIDYALNLLSKIKKGSI